MRSETTQSLTFYNAQKNQDLSFDENQFPEELKITNWKSNLSLVIHENVIPISKLLFKIVRTFDGVEAKTTVEFYNLDQSLFTTFVSSTGRISPYLREFIDILPEKMTLLIDSVSHFSVDTVQSHNDQIDLRLDFDGSPLSPTGKFFFSTEVINQLNNWLKYINRSDPLQFWDNNTKTILDVYDGAPLFDNLEYWELNLINIVYVTIGSSKICKLSNLSMNSFYGKDIYFHSFGNKATFFRLELENQHFHWFFNVALFVIPYFVDTTRLLYFGGKNVNLHNLWSKFPFDPVTFVPLIHPSNIIMINNRKVMLRFSDEIIYQRYRTISILTNDKEYQKFDSALSNDIIEFRIFQNGIDFAYPGSSDPMWIKLSEAQKYAYKICQFDGTSETLIKVFLKDEPAFCGFVPYNLDFKNFLDSKGISFIPAEPVKAIVAPKTTTNINKIKVINHEDGKTIKYSSKISNFAYFTLDEKTWILTSRISGYHQR